MYHAAETECERCSTDHGLDWSFNCSSTFVVLQIKAKERHVAFHHITYYISERVPINKLVFGLYFGLVSD